MIQIEVGILIQRHSVNATNACILVSSELLHSSSVLFPVSRYPANYFIVQ